jgi:hypothetical protein
VTTRDDANRVSEAELLRRITEVIVREAVDEVDSLHIVVCRDPKTGVIAFSGPYASGLSAVCAADQDLRAELTREPESSLAFSVAPLSTPHDHVS